LNRVGMTADRVRGLIVRAFAFAGLTAGLSGSIRLLADFEQQMSTVRAITQATEGQFSLLREEAQRLGATTRFTATQAGEGMLFLARAGFETNEVLGAIEGTLKLAQAGALDLGSAADIASNILQGFRLNVDQTGRVVDVLALAANSANTNVEQLGQGMKFVAPVASGLGVSLEETTAAMAALSDAGLQAGMAGTGLRRVMAELESPSTKTRKILSQLGLSASDVRISTVGLTGALEALKNAGTDTGLALEIFGQRGGPAFEVMTSSIPKIKSMTESLNGAAGTADRIAAIMDDNLNGALLAVTSALQGIILALGDAGATGALTGFFGALAVGLRSVIDNIGTLVNILETLATVLAVRLAGRAIPLAIAGIRALGIAIATNPIGLLVTALTLAIGLLVGFGDELELTVGSTATAFDFLFIVFGRFLDLVVYVTEAVIGSLTGLQGFFDNFDFLSFVRDAAGGVDMLIGVFTGAVAAIKAAWADLPRVLGDILIKGFNFALRSGETFLNGLIFLLNQIPGVSIKALEGLAPQLKNPFEGAARNVGQAALAGFKDGFNASFARKFVDDVASDAEARAVQRFNDEFNREQARLNALAGRMPEAEEDVGATARRLFDPAAQDRSAILEREIGLLHREADVLRLVGDEREVLVGKLAIEEKIRAALRQANADLTEEQLNQMSKLSAAEATRVEEAIRVNLELEREAQLLDEILGPQMRYEQNLRAINSLLADGRISHEQYADKVRDLRIAILEESTSMADGFERGLLRMQRAAEDWANLAEGVMTRAIDGMTDGLTDFIMTGDLAKLNFTDLANSIVADITRMIIKQYILNAVMAAMGGGTTGTSLGSGSGGLGALAGALFGFKDGGSFTVGGSAGTDQNLVAFKATRGERVTVTKPGDSAGGTNITMNIHGVTDADSFRRSEGQIMSNLLAGMERARTRNG
jgi:TP901 family phage tail tape measure protein/lambda family phage tail tape measure protein